jgi:hypothetical protein
VPIWSSGALSAFGKRLYFDYSQSINLTMSRPSSASSSHEPPAGAASTKKRKIDELDIAREGRLCFLVKLPKAVMKAWCDPSRRRSEILGEAVISTMSSNESRRTEITLPENMCPGAPRAYELKFSTDCTKMRVFSVQGRGPSATVALEGFVQESGYMRPKQGLGYRRQLRGRLRHQFLDAKRTAEYEDVDGLEGAFATGETPKEAARRRAKATISTVIDPRAVSRKEMRAQRRAEKRRLEQSVTEGKLKAIGIHREDTVRKVGENLISLGRRRGRVPRKPKLDEEALRTAIFKHFEVQSHWRVRDMNQSLGQPVSYLTRGIREIATYHRSGAHKGTYSLKEEFQTG